MGTFKSKRNLRHLRYCVTFKRKNLWESVKSVGTLKGKKSVGICEICGTKKEEGVS